MTSLVSLLLVFMLTIGPNTGNFLTNKTTSPALSDFDLNILEKRGPAQKKNFLQNRPFSNSENKQYIRLFSFLEAKTASSNVTFPDNTAYTRQYIVHEEGSLKFEKIRETQRNGTVVETLYDANNRVSKRNITPGNNVEGEVMGGVAGIILDARGRPIKLPEDDKTRIRQIMEWFKALKVYPQEIEKYVE